MSDISSLISLTILGEIGTILRFPAWFKPRTLRSYDPGDIAVLSPSNQPEDVEFLLSNQGWSNDADTLFDLQPSDGKYIHPYLIDYPLIMSNPVRPAPHGISTLTHFPT